MKKRRLQQSDIVWALLAGLLVFLQFFWLPGEKGSTSDSYSASIDGKLGLYRTLSRLFPKVVRDQARLCPEKPAAVLLIAPDRYPTSVEIERLHQFVSEGGCLLVAPNQYDSELNMPLLGVKLESRFILQTAMATPAGTTPAVPGSTTSPSTSESTGNSASETSPPESPGEEEAPTIEIPPPRTGTTPTSTADSSADSSDPTNPLQTPSQPSTIPGDSANSKAAAAAAQSDIGKLSELQASSVLSTQPVEWRTRTKLIPPNAYEWTPLVTTTGTTRPGSTAPPETEVEVATWKVGAGTVILSSSPDVFSNRSLLIPESRRLCIRLIERLYSETPADITGNKEPIIMCEFLNASQAYQGTGVLFSPVLRNGSLQLILLAVLAGWLGFHRFGPAVRQQNIQRRSLTESATAVGNLQYRQKDGGAAVKSQLDYLKSQLRRRYGPNVRLDEPESIAVRSGMPADEIAARLKDAERMATSSGIPSSVAAEMIRWLSQLNESLSRSKRTTNP